MPPRLIAFHLPQFHPIPENDRWWGTGFTEWTNVVKARPRFPGHYQPHLPADLGFYDLRLSDTRLAQAELARKYGIHGFCYYHYWFHGRRLLERPVEEIIRSGQPDFPFCLCWANESWSRAWTGEEREVLQLQEYSAEDDRAHIRDLARAFGDSRYIRIEGRPLFLVYRASRLPEPRRTTDVWRAECDRLGIGPVFLARVESFVEESQRLPKEMGFDAAVEFMPDWGRSRTRLTDPRRISRWLSRLSLQQSGYNENLVHHYDALVEEALGRQTPAYELFRCASPSWDNSARRQSKATIFHESSPKRYEHWLRALLTSALERPPGRRIVFVNAWNEWAEGNHLEPDQRYGRAYLEATRGALESSRCVTGAEDRVDGSTTRGSSSALDGSMVHAF
jgi:lipopolysaccharide biosynthesis protein